MYSTFGINPEDIIQISAKTGEGVDKVLEAILTRIPPPSASAQAPLKAFLFDSMYDSPLASTFRFLLFLGMIATAGWYRWLVYRTEFYAKVSWQTLPLQLRLISLHRGQDCFMLHSQEVRCLRRRTHAPGGGIHR